MRRECADNVMGIQITLQKSTGKESVLPIGVALSTFHNAPSVSVHITGHIGTQSAEQVPEHSESITVLRIDAVREEALCLNCHGTYRQNDIGAMRLNSG